MHCATNTLGISCSCGIVILVSFTTFLISGIQITVFSIAMKYLVFFIILAVFEGSYPLNPEILKYDQILKDFEATGRALKQQEKGNKKIDGSILKRENSNHSSDHHTTITISRLNNHSSDHHTTPTVSPLGNHSSDHHTTTTVSPLLHTYRIENPLPLTDAGERPFTPYWTQTEPSKESTSSKTKLDDESEIDDVDPASTF